MNNDPFGGEQFDLPGAAIDKMSVKAIKDASGNLTNVVVSMRSTEQLAASTLATGTRLAVVDSNYVVLRTATATPSLATNDPYTVQWTLSAAEWNTLTNTNPVTIGGTTHTPASLSVAATTNLRAAMWAAEVPILPAPSWTTTTSVRTTADLPVEILDSLASLSDLITTTPPASEKTRTPYDVPNLGMLGKQTGDANIEMTMAATFQAQPFAEPFSRKFYVRARWYDPETGTWLTPDPLGYRDSANPYAFAGGDPINRRDPRGQFIGPIPQQVLTEFLRRLTAGDVGRDELKAFVTLLASSGTRAQIIAFITVAKHLLTEAGTSLAEMTAADFSLAVVGGLALAGVVVELGGDYVPVLGDPEHRTIKQWWEELAADAIVKVTSAPLAEPQRAPSSPTLPPVHEEDQKRNRTLYRVMYFDEANPSLPKVGTERDMLLARVGTDIHPVAGMLEITTEGISANPDSIKNIPSSLLPRQYGGKRSAAQSEKMAVFRIQENMLPPGLQFLSDTPTHGVIAPRVAMPEAAYQALLQSTRHLWVKVPGGGAP